MTIRPGSLVRARGIRLRDGRGRRANRSWNGTQTPDGARQRVVAFQANQINGVWQDAGFAPNIVIDEGTVMLVLATQNLGQMTNIAVVCLVVDKPMFLEVHALEEV